MVLSGTEPAASSHAPTLIGFTPAAFAAAVATQQPTVRTAVTATARNLSAINATDPKVEKEKAKDPKAEKEKAKDVRVDKQINPRQTRSSRQQWRI